MKFLIVILAMANICRGDISHLLQSPYGNVENQQGQQNPYSFQYSSGRYPGQVDRFQSESNDGAGHVRGSYAYTGDNNNGFQPSLRNYEDVQQPTGSEAVRRETETHLRLYDRIANAHARHYENIADAHGRALSPPATDTPAVVRAKNRHYNLFQKIAAEHAAIGAQRKNECLPLK